jgi:hypothetical protein
LIYSGFGLDRFSIYSGFGLDRFLIYSGFGLDRFSIYSGFGLDRLCTSANFGWDSSKSNPTRIFDLTIPIYKTNIGNASAFYIGLV